MRLTYVLMLSSRRIQVLVKPSNVMLQYWTTLNLSKKAKSFRKGKGVACQGLRSAP